jgi:cobalamin biosynthesis protein CbiG
MVIKVGDGSGNEMAVIAQEIEKHLKSLGIEVRSVDSFTSPKEEHEKALSDMVKEGFPVTLTVRW